MPETLSQPADVVSMNAPRRSWSSVRRSWSFRREFTSLLGNCWEDDLREGIARTTLLCARAGVLQSGVARSRGDPFQSDGSDERIAEIEASREQPTVEADHGLIIPGVWRRVLLSVSPGKAKRRTRGRRPVMVRQGVPPGVPNVMPRVR